MGLFDYVVCKVKLPDRDEVTNERFQTKEFDCPYMELYEITEDGSLRHEIVRYEDRSDPKAEGLMRLMGCMTPVPIGWEVLADYHGYVHFGDYRAKFTDGKLQKIELLEDDGA